MRKFYCCCFSFALIFFFSCERKVGTDTPIVNQILVQGPWSDYFGKRINPSTINSFEHTSWGRDNQEIFVSTFSKLVRINLATGDEQVIENKSGIVHRQSNDNTGVLFTGEISGVNGNYVFNYQANAVEKIMSASQGYYSNIYLSGNNIAFRSDSLSPSAISCSAPWDFWCGGFLTKKNTQYLLVRNSTTPREFVNRLFDGFTKDGTRAVLRSLYAPAFLFVNPATGTITDSIRLQMDKVLFIDHIIRSLQYDFVSPQKSLDIYNASTAQLIKKLIIGAWNVLSAKWSWDGTKIYYWGFENSNHNTQVLCVIDAATGEEKRLATYPSSINIIDVSLSNDNKRMLVIVNQPLFSTPVHAYLKEIQ
jgi:hypothetical protein